MPNSFSLCGLDEAGRGALAGPLVAAAAVLNSQKLPHNLPLKDGKLLSREQRNKWQAALLKLKVNLTTEVISARQINNHGIAWANKEVFRRLIKKVSADKYLVDGNLKLGRLNGKTDKINSRVDADATVPEVILAGIIAKAKRDKIMSELHLKYPRYHWNQNAGYGTKKHLEAIKISGKTRFHRDVFVNTALLKTVSPFRGLKPKRFRNMRTKGLFSFGD